MERVRLTKKNVQALEPTGKLYRVPDSETRGLYLQVSPAGVKSWVLSFWYAPEGRQRFLTIGQFPAIIPDDARKQALGAKTQVSHGIDPATQKKEKRKASTVAEAVDEFLADHGKIRLKPKTLTSYTETAEKRIKPKLGRLKITDLTTQKVAVWHHEQKDHPRAANLALAVLSKLCSWARLHELRLGNNPCQGVPRFHENQRDRVPDAGELGSIGKAFRDAEKAAGKLTSPLACLMLIIQTGCRKNEARHLSWDNVDIDARIMKIPDSKTGSITYALPEEAVEILKRLHETKRSKWVFPGEKVDIPTGTVDSTWRAICRAAQVEGLRIHDLRHTWGTTAGELNISGPLIRAAMNHKTLQASARYLNLRDQAKINAADLVSRVLTDALKGVGKEQNTTSS